MKVTVIAVKMRFAVILIEDGGHFNTRSEYSIYLNGKFLRKTNESMNYIGGLKPSTEYEIKICGEEIKEVSFRTYREFVTLNVKKFGAKGDGVNDDTVFIQSAIYACPAHSRVLIPAGKYKITSLFLRTDVNIELAKDAELIADSERYNHPIFPGMIQSYDEQDEYNLGTWEGNPLPMFAGIITGVSIYDACIYGEGTINGNASHDDWWDDEKKMRGAFRPRLIFLERCGRVGIYGITLKNSPSWTVHPYFSNEIILSNLKINNPADSPNTDGIDVESCERVRIEGVDFSLGDDCIALKSGKIYMGMKKKRPSENILIRHCRMQDGHGAVTLGSEMSAGIKNVTVRDCLFRNTDRGLRIKTRRGRGRLSVVSNVEFRNIAMDGVKTPFVANSFYFCDPDGRTSYVQSREPLPVDDRTPQINKLAFEDITCENCHAAAAFFIGLPERKIDEIIMRNVSISFAENAVPAVPAMLCGVDKMSRKGIYAENVENLTLENVTVSGCEGEPCELRGVDNVKGEVKCR